VRQALTKDPFSAHILKRSGDPPKAFDILDIMDAYIPSMLRYIHYKPIAPEIGIAVNNLPEGTVLKDYATRYARNFFGVASEYRHMEKAVNDGARSLVGYTYAYALELNPRWFSMHLSKVPINTWPELGGIIDGPKYMVKGFNQLTTAEGKELVARSGVMLDTLWTFPETMTQFKRNPGSWARATTSLSDAIDRGVSYLGALEKAKDKGFFGPAEEVGKLTWDRLNELAANGVDVQKGLDYAYGVVARSQFMYTPAYLQMAIQEHKLMGQFKSFTFREAGMIANVRRLAKEAKAQHEDGEAFALQKVAEGQYEYIDAVAKYRRLVAALVGSAAFAYGFGARFFPFHMSTILSPAVMFLEDFTNLIHKTITGQATEAEWKRFATSTIALNPVMGYAEEKLGWKKPPREKKVRGPLDFEPIPAQGPKFDLEPLPQ